MILNKKVIVIGLLFPILALMALAGYRQFLSVTGKEVILPISGYDPRDLLAGRYLRFTINYDVPDVCPKKSYNKENAFMCLDPKQFSYTEPEQCATLIKGICRYNQFTAGIERFYIPEKNARYFEDLLRSSQDASVVLSISSSGDAQVKDLLINGQSINNMAP